MTPIYDKMSFGGALDALKHGLAVQREGWNGKGLVVKLHCAHGEKMTLPYLYIEYPTDAENTPGARVPWLASQTDILAEDWRILDSRGQYHKS